MDSFASALGPTLVFLVILMNLHVILVAYLVGLPHYWAKNRVMASILVLMGQWLKANVAFHYYKAYSLGPGKPPEKGMVTNAVQVMMNCQ